MNTPSVGIEDLQVHSQFQSKSTHAGTRAWNSITFEGRLFVATADELRLTEDMLWIPALVVASERLCASGLHVALELGYVERLQGIGSASCSAIRAATNEALKPQMLD